MTLKINYLDKQKANTKNTALFLCKETKISEFKGIFDDKINLKIQKFIKNSKKIKQDTIDSLNLDFDQKILIIFLANKNDKYQSEKNGAKFYTHLKSNKIENITLIGSNFSSVKNKIEFNQFLHGIELKSYEFNLYKSKKKSKTD